MTFFVQTNFLFCSNYKMTFMNFMVKKNAFFWNGGKIKMFLLFVLIGVVMSHIRPFDPKLLSIVDQRRNGNYLVRSGSLLSSDYNEVAWTNITDALANVGITGDYNIYDVCLLNYNEIDDLLSINIEANFFQGENKNFVPWPITGETFGVPSSNEYLTNLLSNTFNEWSLDYLPDLIVLLNTLMSDTTNKKIIIVHCMHGIDRTGEVVGAYVLNNGIQTLCDFLSQEITLSGISSGQCHFAPKLNNYNSLQWYFRYSLEQQPVLH